jgi:hypothetical protein
LAANPANQACAWSASDSRRPPVSDRRSGGPEDERADRAQSRSGVCSAVEQVKAFQGSPGGHAAPEGQGRAASPRVRALAVPLDRVRPWPSWDWPLASPFCGQDQLGGWLDLRVGT